MANHQDEQFIHVDPRTAAEMRRRGTDPREMEQSTQVILRYLRASLPATPLSAAARLSALPGPDPSGVDHLSALPFSLLRDIVSRLLPGTPPAPPRSPAAGAPVPEGRRHPTRADTPALYAAVSRVLAAHPGPFRAVHLVCGFMDARQGQLARWARRLADKGVRELVLVNRPWPLDVPLPAALLDAATLTRLYLGVWKFPDTSALPRRAAPPFPHLRELVLCCVDIENRDVDSLLAGCPLLETFGMLGNRNDGMRLCLAGQRLRCVQICMSVLGGVAVVDAPSLERLFVRECFTHDGSCIRVRIGNAPKLRLLGHLRPGVDMLEIRNTVFINAGIRVSPSAMAPSVKILGLNVRFGARNDAKMVPAFLRCFPSVETLHIVSEETKGVTGNPNLNFWREAGLIECIWYCIKDMTFREFRGEQSESTFLKFVFESAQVLRNVTIVGSGGVFASIPEVISKVQNLQPESWGNNCAVMLHRSSGPDGGPVWSFQKGLDFSVADPFAYEMKF
ncbi:hypothetical protein ACP4OV_028994 [Aristida adscensionis]